MKRTLIILLALSAMTYGAATKTEAPAAVVDPTLASSETTAAQAPAADVSKLQDPLATTPIPESNLPELKEPKRNALGIFFDINGGTQGVGFNVGYEFNRYLKLRFRSGFLSYKYTDEWDDMNLEAKLDANNTGLILDVHPFGGSFHISAGLNFSPIKIQARGEMDGLGEYAGETYDLGNYTYKVEGDNGWVFGEYSWRSCQPYLGIGWSSDGDGDRSLYFFFDLGINFMGSGNFSVSHSDNVYQKPLGASDDQYSRLDDDNILKDSLMEEGEDFFKIADKLYVYPVLQLGIGVRF